MQNICLNANNRLKRSHVSLSFNSLVNWILLPKDVKMKECEDLMMANEVQLPNSLGNSTQLVATIVDKFAPISAASGGQTWLNAGSY